MPESAQARRAAKNKKMFGVNFPKSKPNKPGGVVTGGGPNTGRQSSTVTGGKKTKKSRKK